MVKKDISGGGGVQVEPWKENKNSKGMRNGRDHIPGTKESLWECMETDGILIKS